MRFDIRAMRAGSDACTLRFDAADAEAAAEQARRQGYAVLKVRPAARVGRLFPARSSDIPLGLFSQELLTLLEAGLSLVEAIEALREKESRPERQRLLARIVGLLYEGRSLSQALEAFPAVFPPLYVATVRASEKTGGLPDALARYVAYQAQLDAVRKRLTSAAIYPALLMGVGLMVVVFLLAYVVPRFSRIFEELRTDLPFASRLLVQWGQWADGRGWHLLLGAAAFLALATFWLTQPETRRRMLAGLASLPAIGERLRVIQLARFHRTIGMLLRGGIAIMPALQMTADLLHGPLRSALSGAAGRIREGVPISTAMEAFGLTTPVSLRMLRVGERSGRMGEMMEKIARFYDEETARWIDWFVRLFEPLLMAFIGIAIGAIVVMMYFPIFELAGSIQ